MRDLWLIEYERVFEDLDAGKIDFSDAATRLKSLGLDPDEIQETLHAYWETA